MIMRSISASPKLGLNSYNKALNNKLSNSSYKLGKMLICTSSLGKSLHCTRKKDKLSSVKFASKNFFSKIS